MPAGVSMVVDLPAVPVFEQKHNLPVSVSRHPPLQRPWRGELIRPPLKVVPAMTTVLRAELGGPVFQLDRCAGEMGPPHLLPQGLDIAARDVQGLKVCVLVTAVGEEPVRVGPADRVLITIIERADFVWVIMPETRLPFGMGPGAHQLRRHARSSCRLPWGVCC